MLQLRPAALVAGLSLVGLCTLLAAPPAQAAVGAQVLLQTWNPKSPQTQGLLTPARSPNIVSDTFAGFWSGPGRAAACAAVKQALARFQPRLYDTECKLPANALLQSLAGGNGQIVLRLTAPKSVLLASADIDVLPDPRFSVDFDLQLDLTLTVTGDPNRLLQVASATASVTHVHLDSQNLVADVAKVASDLVDFLGGPDFIAQAEQAMTKQGIDFSKQASAHLGPVNDQLKLPAALAGDKLRVGVWSRPGMLTVAFAPGPVPLGGGAMEGTVRWDPAAVELSRCEDLTLAATVQVGPRALLSPEGGLGSAPMRTVGTLRPLQVAAGSCRYRLDGLGVGLPHQLEASANGAARPVRTRAGHMVFVPMRAEGWSGETVMPEPLAAARNYVIEASQLLAPKRALPTSPAATGFSKPAWASDGPMDPRGPRVQPAAVEQLKPASALRPGGTSGGVANVKPAVTPQR